MAATDLTNLANVKLWLGITSTDDDVQLARLITAASDFVAQYCSRSFVSTAVTDRKYHGNGNSTLVLRNWPIISVQSLAIDGVTVPATNYTFFDRMIYLTNGVFTKGLANVSVNYTAGYAVVPFGLEQAVIELIVFKYREKERIGHASKQLAGEVVSFIIADLHPAIKKALDQYSDKVPA
jgi:hypothetical protein